MDTSIKPIHYNLIARRIRQGRCVPFLGAGVNVSNETYQYTGLPLAYEVTLRFMQELTSLNGQKLKELETNSANDIKLRIEQIIAATSNTQSEEMRKKKASILQSLFRATLPDLARAALHVEVDIGFGNLMELLREALPDTECEPSPLLKLLAKLRLPVASNGNTATSPFRLIVTTNYDDLLERAFDENNMPFEKVVQQIGTFEDRKGLENRLAKPKGTIIYKIHGSFKDESNRLTKRRLILTEDDYIEFLANFEDPVKGVPRLIRSELVSSEVGSTATGETEVTSGTTILFLGYGLQDWDFQTIYKTFVEPINPRPRSFAIQKNPPDFWVRYWDKKDVTILDVDLYEFASELESLLP